MDSSNVTPNFYSLLGEIDLVLEELNQQGAQEFYTSNYRKAKEILKSVEEVNLIKKQLNTLCDEWKKINLNIISERKNKEKVDINKTPNKQKLPKGAITKAENFEVPILIALDSLGGAGDIHDIINIIENLMVNDLNDYDWQALPSDKNSVRWKNNVQWARLKLVHKGYLSNQSPKGIWEITDSGRKIIHKDGD